MAMARMKRSFGERNLPTYQRSDTLNQFLQQGPATEGQAVDEANPMQAQMQKMLQDAMTSDPNKAELPEAPWLGPLDPMGDY